MDKLPAEIIAKITIYIDDIYTLESFLAVYKSMQNVTNIKNHRMILTIQANKTCFCKLCRIMSSRIARQYRWMKYIINYEFFWRKSIKRDGKVIKKKRVYYEFRSIHNIQCYYKFMKRYKDVWLY